MKIAFDVDGTLINAYSIPPFMVGSKNPWNKMVRNTWVIDMLIGFRQADHYIIVWSGGGKQYAEQVCRDLGIEKFVHECWSKTDNDGSIDICFDDQEVKLAKTNIRV